jgi:hypothetical protein
MKILGQIVDTKQTGSPLVSGLTLRIKTSKENVQILGAHAYRAWVESRVLFRPSQAGSRSRSQRRRFDSDPSSDARAGVYKVQLASGLATQGRNMPVASPHVGRWHPNEKTREEDKIARRPSCEVTYLQHYA